MEVVHFLPRTHHVVFHFSIHRGGIRALGVERDWRGSDEAGEYSGGRAAGVSWGFGQLVMRDNRRDRSRDEQASRTF
jgi:hypothetical protein